MLLDQNLVYPEKYNPIVEYIRTHNKHQLEWILHDFYQEPNKQENLQKKFLFIKFNLDYLSPPTNESPAPLVSTISNGFFTGNSLTSCPAK